MPLSKIEALEWASDFAERTKLFEIPPVSARDRYDIVNSLAEAAMLASPPSTVRVDVAVPTDLGCLAHIESLVDRLRNSSNTTNKVRYRDEIKLHINALKNPATVHPAHPAEADEPAVAYRSTKGRSEPEGDE